MQTFLATHISPLLIITEAKNVRHLLSQTLLQLGLDHVIQYWQMGFEGHVSLKQKRSMGNSLLNIIMSTFDNWNCGSHPDCTGIDAERLSQRT